MKIVIELDETTTTANPRVYVLEHGEYIVRKGDTLSAIASAFGTTVATLVSDNAIPDEDLIFPGQRFLI